MSVFTSVKWELHLPVLLGGLEEMMHLKVLVQCWAQSGGSSDSPPPPAPAALCLQLGIRVTPESTIPAPPLAQA